MLTRSVQVTISQSTHGSPRAPYGFKTLDIKLKVAFVGPILLNDIVTHRDLDAIRNLIKRQHSMLAKLSPTQAETLLGATTQAKREPTN